MYQCKVMPFRNSSYTKIIIYLNYIPYYILTTSEYEYTISINILLVPAFNLYMYIWIKIETDKCF